MPFSDRPGACPTLHDFVLVGPGVKSRLLPSENIMLAFASAREAREYLPALYFGMPKLKPDKAREMLPIAEGSARRDVFSPWMRVVVAHLLLQAGDSRGSAALNNILQAEGGDFTEWISISSYLYDVGRQDLGDAAFDRGYRDLLQRGYDPRLTQSIYQRFALFASTRTRPLTLFDLPVDQVERIFRLGPYTEFGWIIWNEYASVLERRRQAGAQLWHARSQEARQYAPALLASAAARFDRVILLPLAVMPGVIIFIVVVSNRYTAQRRADLEAGRRKYAIPLFSNLTYWSRAERWALLLMAVLGWATMGVAGLDAAAFMRAFRAPITSQNGTYDGPIVRGHFQSLPASPERDLLLAMSYQQGGDSRRAEDLYRRLPQYAESWNNLGAILKRRTREQEAREAFQRALQIDPQLHEARLNLDGSTPDLWTELHKRYVPVRPMLAIARPQQLQAAYRGGSHWRPLAWSALRGPFWVANGGLVWMFVDMKIAVVTIVGYYFSQAFWVGSLFFALLMTFVLKQRPVGEKAAARHWIVNVAFPGTGRSWHIFGGLVLAAFLVCCLALLFFVMQHSPWLLSASQMWYLRWYARSLDMSVLNPSPLVFMLPALVLFAINFGMIRRARRKLKHRARQRVRGM